MLRGDAYFMYFSGGVFHYQGGGVSVSGSKKAEVGRGPVVMRDWATTLGFTIDPCPFIKEEEPVIEPVGSDLDQLFAAFTSYLATPAGRPYRYYHIELWGDESGAIEGPERERLTDWSDSKKGVTKIKALIDNS